jgi:hypothetical protein
MKTSSVSVRYHDTRKRVFFPTNETLEEGLLACRLCVNRMNESPSKSNPGKKRLHAALSKINCKEKIIAVNQSNLSVPVVPWDSIFVFSPRRCVGHWVYMSETHFERRRRR